MVIPGKLSTDNYHRCTGLPVVLYCCCLYDIRIYQCEANAILFYTVCHYLHKRPLATVDLDTAQLFVYFISANCRLWILYVSFVLYRIRLTTYGRRAFSVAGPTAWNSLPVAFRDPTISDACFRRHLKTVLFAQQRRHHSV